MSVMHSAWLRSLIKRLIEVPILSSMHGWHTLHFKEALSATDGGVVRVGVSVT